jgi:hypothetical protein
MSNGKKTITSGPMIEQLSLFGTVTEETPVGFNRVNLKVRLDDEITVEFVPQGEASENDRVTLTLDVGEIELGRRNTRGRSRRRPR